jgi:L-asparaginase II
MLNTASHTLLVETTRGIAGSDSSKQHVECQHWGSIAVTDTSGKLVAYAGDPQWVSFTRSTIKPFQAIPLLRSGAVKAFGFDSADIAIACASHSGEEIHLAAAARVLAKCGCTVGDLGCGTHPPLRYRDGVPPAGEVYNALHNNCSGKHAGFLAYCRHLNLPLNTYLDFEHPLQQAVRQSLQEVCEVSLDDLPNGTDGCSAPNYALPLKQLALGYARLAQGKDPALAQAYAAMTQYPELVSGVGRNDLDFMQAGGGDWVAKIGADGVQLIGIKSAGIGIAIKLADGNWRALTTAAVEVLRQLNLLGSNMPASLRSWARPVLRNANGWITGEVRASFQLRSAA